MAAPVLSPADLPRQGQQYHLVSPASTMVSLPVAPAPLFRSGIDFDG